MNPLSYLWKKYGPNPLDRLLKRAQQDRRKNILIYWNRGLGDIPLGLYALNLQIHQFLPDAKITYLTRVDLQSGFELLGNVSLLIDPTLKRGAPLDLPASLNRCHTDPSQFDLILERPDPTRWLVWQLGSLTPKLNWNPQWDTLPKRFLLCKDTKYIGVHVQTETRYNYEKNWPLSYWTEFFERCTQEHNVTPILFGFSKTPPFSSNVFDLRGDTTLFEMLAIIKNHCSHLLVPDSGVLSILYYLNTSFPIDVVSLWADPHQGILKQNVPSPNPLLKHQPLIAKHKDLHSVSVTSALHTLFGGAPK